MYIYTYTYVLLLTQFNHRGCEIRQKGNSKTTSQSEQKGPSESTANLDEQGTALSSGTKSIALGVTLGARFGTQGGPKHPKAPQTDTQTRRKICHIKGPTMRQIFELEKSPEKCTQAPTGRPRGPNTPSQGTQTDTQARRKICHIIGPTMRQILESDKSPEKSSQAPTGRPRGSKTLPMASPKHPNWPP